MSAEESMVPTKEEVALPLSRMGRICQSRDIEEVNRLLSEGWMLLLISGSRFFVYTLGLPRDKQPTLAPDENL